MMQQMNNARGYSPAYIEKLTLYFTPSGQIIIRAGNQHLVATAADVTEIIESRLTQHAFFAKIMNRENGGAPDVQTSD